MFRPSAGMSIHGVLNIKFVSIRSCILQQMPIIPSSPHAILGFLVPVLVLVNFLQLQYQGKDFSPFETHPKTMGFAVASLFLYCLTHDAGLSLTSSHLKPAYYARVVHGGMGLSSSLLAVSLASILFQGPVWFPLYFLYIMFSSRQMICYRLDVLWSWLQKKLMAGFHSGPHLPKRALLPV